MRAWTSSIVATLFALGFATSVSAQCPLGKEHKGEGVAAKADGAKCSKDASKCAATCKHGDKEGCMGKALAATGMPLMSYKVGDQSTNCPKEAEKLIAGQDVKVQYVVGETEYNDKMEALKAYETALNEYLESITAVRYAVGEKCVACPNAAASMAKASGETVKFRVASFTYADKGQAEKAAQLAKQASDKVEMKTVALESGTATGPRTCGAKDGVAAGKKCEYVIGEMKTCCETTAKVEFARARILAAYNALAEFAAEPPAGKEVASGA